MGVGSTSRIATRLITGPRRPLFGGRFVAVTDSPEAPSGHAPTDEPNVAESEAELRAVYERAKRGGDAHGTIDHGEAYISYATVAAGGSRRLKLWVGHPNVFAAVSPPEAIREAASTARRAVPDVDFSPTVSGELVSAIALPI